MLVLVDLSLDLRVGDFRGAFVKEARAGHDNNTFRVNLDEFPDEGGAFDEGPCHLGVIEGYGPGRLENKLELALGRVGIFAQDFPEGFFTRTPHGLLDSLDTAEGVFYQFVLVIFQAVLEGLGENRVLGKPVWDRSLIAGDLPLDRDFGGHRGVVAAELGFGFRNIDGGVGFDLEIDSLPRED